jgi:hypothetical protein
LASRIDELRWTVHTQLVGQLGVMKQAVPLPLDTTFNGWAGDLNFNWRLESATEDESSKLMDLVKTLV